MTETVEQSDPQEGYKTVHLGPKSVKIPIEWDIQSLDELTNNSGNYGANVSAVEYDPHKPQYIRITDIGDDGFLKDDDRKSISRDDAEGYYLSEGDLLFARTGATAGKSYLCREEEPDAAYAGYLIRFEVDESKVDPDYLGLYVQSKLYLDWVDRITRHGAQQNINAGEYRSLDVLYPPLPEQRHIASILSKVDEQIQQTDEIIEEHQEVRGGLLQDLFHRGAVKHEHILDPSELAETSGGVNTGMDQTTVGRIPAGWKTVRLGEVTESSSYGLNASAEDFDLENLRYLRITDVADDGHLKEDDPKSISRDKADGYELIPGDLVFARTGATVGKTFLYEESHPEAAYAGYLIRFQLNRERILPEFVFYFTQTDNYDRWVTRITRQGAQENINTGEYSSILLPLPPLEEQRKIVSILKTVAQKIEQERETKKVYQDLKRGLMQDLLTGKVRVDAD